jgi:hypothetical protein
VGSDAVGVATGPHWAAGKRCKVARPKVKGVAVDFGLKQKRARIGRKEIDKRERIFYFEKQPNQMNSNTNLHSNTQKQCTSMYATVAKHKSEFKHSKTMQKHKTPYIP